MSIPIYCLNWALSLMVAYSLIVQVSALDTPGMIMRKRPVPFASEPTAPGLAQRQGYGRDGNSPSPTTASLIKYNNLGCWSDTTTRILPGSSTAGSDINVEYCQNFCSQNSYTIFGVEAIANCYCGNTLANKLASASSDDYSVTCTGNPKEICGATWRINIYSSTKTVAYSTASPSGTSGGGGLSTSNQIALFVGLGLVLPSLLVFVRGETRKGLGVKCQMLNQMVGEAQEIDGSEYH
ncbi:hypothetical protein BGZ57DRAFT_967889 [Hyaloscypha finlandica]|nr:hypothetical protein BGZ57DRAFT_967889 [Hyaloscypha finlandica]